MIELNEHLKSNTQHSTKSTFLSSINMCILSSENKKSSREEEKEVRKRQRNKKNFKACIVFDN